MKETSKWKVTDFISDVAIFIFMALGGVWRYIQLISTELWYDEVFTGLLVRGTWENLFKIIKADRVHPPLYFMLVKLWTLIFGENPFTIRGFSLLFGILTIPLSYHVVQQLSIEKPKKRLIGIVTAFAFTVSPFFVTYSIEARAYAFLGFMVLLSMFFFIRAMRNMYKPSRDFLFWVLTIIIIFFTHYLSILIILGYICAYILIVMLDKKLIYNKTIWQYITGILLTAWVLITYVWHTFHLEKLLDKNNLGWIQRADLSILPHAIYAFLFGVDRQMNGTPPVNELSFPLFPGTIGFLILILTLIAAVLVIQKLKDKKDLLKDILIIAPVGLIPIISVILASSLGLHLFVERYSIGYAALLIIAGVVVFWHLFEKKLFIGPIIYAVLLLCVVYPKPLSKYTQIRDYITTQSSKNLIFEDPVDLIMFKYYSPDRDGKIIIKWPGTDYSSWAMISRADELDLNAIPNNSVIVVWKDSDFEVPKEWRLVKEIEDRTIWIKE